MFKYLVVLIGLVHSLGALEFERIAPHEPEPSCPGILKDIVTPLGKVEKDQVLIPKLKGIRIVDDPANLSDKPISCVQIIDVCLPTSYKALEDHLSCYIGRPLTKNKLLQIKRDIICFYQKCDRPIVYVFIPEQNITHGGLQVVVYESKLWDVSVKGNCFFCNKSYTSQMRNKKNCPINTETLIQDLDWLNRNPFRCVDAVFIPSEKEGYTDIELLASDRKPIRFFTGVENTGLDLTGHNRWFFGINHGNVFGVGHLLSYQFTTGTHYDEFWAHSFSYTIPFCWRHVLTFYGGLSCIDAILATENQNAIQDNRLDDLSLMKTMGRSGQLSFRYNIPLDLVCDILQDVSFGFDYKRSDTSLTLNGVPFTGQSVNLTQFMVGYNQGYAYRWFKQGLTFDIYFSPFEWLPDQSDSDFNSLREGASNTYIYARAAWTPVFFMPYCFILEPTFRWQLSSTNLLASEQMGLGGYNSVRGYEERQINVDNGFIINIDLKAKPIPLFSYFRKARCMDEGLVLLAFFDLGYGKNHSLIQGEKNSYTIYSIGPGFRYHLVHNISVRGDWGYQLKNLDCSSRSSMFHFGAVFSF